MFASIPSSVSSFITTQNPAQTVSTSQNPVEENKEPAANSKASETVNRNQNTEEIQQKQELAEIQQLKKRDQEVKAHEQAHLSAAGSLALGGASYTYQTGPNGVRYAVGGEVSIDTSPVQNDPEATLRKADTIRLAALAPAEPSTQDQLVASNATAMASQARTDLIELKQQEEQGAIKQSQLAKKSETDQTERDDSSPQTNKQIKQQTVIGSMINFEV